MSDLPRARCPTSGFTLWARVKAGVVVGVDNNGNEVPSPMPSPDGTRTMALYGDDLPFDLVTEVRAGPVYVIESERVVRTFTKRPKLASEMLREISWWYAALNRPHGESCGMSPAAVNDAARANMARN